MTVAEGHILFQSQSTKTLLTVFGIQTTPKPDNKKFSWLAFALPRLAGQAIVYCRRRLGSLAGRHGNLI